MSQIKLKHSGGNGVIIAAPSSNPAADRTLLLPSDGDSTIDTLGRAGNILQVVSTTKTDLFSTTSSSLTEITGLNVSITPTSTSSKIHLEIDISVGGATAYVGFNIKRDSTLIAVSTAPSNSGSHDASFGNVILHNSGIDSGGFNFLDSPNTTSTITYKVFVISTYNNQTVTINRSHNNSAALFDMGGCSTITAKEVAA